MNLALFDFDGTITSRGLSRHGAAFADLRHGLPPTVIFHGKADAVVPYADVEKFCAESQKLGNRCQVFGYDGAPHGFFNPRVNKGKWYDETLQELDRFLTTIGYLPARIKSSRRLRSSSEMLLLLSMVIQPL